MKMNYLSPAEAQSLQMADGICKALFGSATVRETAHSIMADAKAMTSVKSPASNWTPLVKLVGEHLATSFMFMGEAEGIFLYKHAQTRQYLNVDKFGQTYSYNGNCRGYNLIGGQSAVFHAFDLNSSLLTTRDQAGLLVELAKVLGRPTQGAFASWVWEWSNSRHTQPDIAARAMKDAGYVAFEGYPLVRKS
jgi:hypothetical protein